MELIIGTDDNIVFKIVSIVNRVHGFKVDIVRLPVSLIGSKCKQSVVFINNYYYCTNAEISSKV